MGYLCPVGKERLYTDWIFWAQNSCYPALSIRYCTTLRCYAALFKHHLLSGALCFIYSL